MPYIMDNPGSQPNTPYESFPNFMLRAKHTLHKPGYKRLIGILHVWCVMSAIGDAELLHDAKIFFDRACHEELFPDFKRFWHLSYRLDREDDKKRYTSQQEVGDKHGQVPLLRVVMVDYVKREHARLFADYWIEEENWRHWRLAGRSGKEAESRVEQR